MMIKRQGLWCYRPSWIEDKTLCCHWGHRHSWMLPQHLLSTSSALIAAPHFIQLSSFRTVALQPPNVMTRPDPSSSFWKLLSHDCLSSKASNALHTQWEHFCSQTGGGVFDFLGMRLRVTACSQTLFEKNLMGAWQMQLDKHDLGNIESMFRFFYPGQMWRLYISGCSHTESCIKEYLTKATVLHCYYYV